MSIDSSRIDIHVDVTSEAQVLVRRDGFPWPRPRGQNCLSGSVVRQECRFAKKVRRFCADLHVAATRVRRESMTSTECSRREHHVIGCWRPRAPARATASAFLVLTSPLRRDCDTNVAVRVRDGQKCPSAAALSNMVPPNAIPFRASDLIAFHAGHPPWRQFCSEARS